MKRYKRVFGIDDGPFSRDSDSRAPLVGVMARFDGYMEGLAVRSVAVDGTDSTETVLSMFEAHFSSQIDYIMLDGITVAGFNVCDIVRISNETGRPVICVTRKDPDLERMAEAIRKYFTDSFERISTLTSTEVKRVVLKTGSPLYINVAGCSKDEAVEAIERSIIRGNIPEPIRMAHMIAGAIKNGENRGKV